MKSVAASMTTSPVGAPGRRGFVGWMGWVGVTAIAPFLGIFGQPGEWYTQLDKLSWNPPGWLFGPVWTVLYLLMATAAWMVWKRGGWERQGGALSLYLVQLALNAAWSPVFFGMQLPGVAFGVILLLLAAIVATMSAFFRVSRAAGTLLIPYLAWVSFATCLNYTLWQMNR